MIQATQELYDLVRVSQLKFHRLAMRLEEARCRIQDICDVNAQSSKIVRSLICHAADKLTRNA